MQAAQQRNTDEFQSVVIRPSILYFGTPVAMISTLNPDGTTNLSPMSSAWALGDRVVLGMADAGQGCANLLRTGECVINLPCADDWRSVEAIGRTTGRSPVPGYKQQMGYVHEPDKFGCGGLTPAEAELVQPLRIADYPMQLEARLVNSYPLTQLEGESEAPAVRILETHVVRVHAHERIVKPGTQRIDTSRWSPLLYVFRDYFGTGSKLGANFRVER
jgi:flavin reductase (DIM6/NTAB) family NADH-FMN oxidoreductase RutF